MLDLPTGCRSPLLALVFASLVAALNGSNGITGMGRPSDVVTSPDGRFVYTVATANQSILWFARNATTGALTLVDRVVSRTATPPGTIPHLDRPFAIATSPDGEHLYVAAGIASAGTSAITWFDRDLGTGAITYRGSLTNDSGPGLYALDTPVDVLVSADGANVYVTAFEARAITGFARDAQTGDLSFLQVVVDDANGVDGLEGIQRLAESSNGTSMNVSSASRPTTVPGVGGVATFARAPNGTLSFVAAIHESLFGRGEPHGIAMSPDGASVYAISDGRYSGVGGLTPGKLAVFTRDAQSGALTLVDRFDSGSAGVIGLAGAIDLNVTPDGIGAELALLAPLYARLRRKRMARPR